MQSYIRRMHYNILSSRRAHRVNCKRIPGYRARHWVVERTHSWMNRFRRLLIRWEKKVENYVVMLYFACTCITQKDPATVLNAYNLFPSTIAGYSISQNIECVRYNIDGNKARSIVLTRNGIIHSINIQVASYVNKKMFKWSNTLRSS